MERVEIAPGVAFSRLVYGLYRLGARGQTNPRDVIAKIELCLDQGITTFDQADIYADYGSEQMFGAALATAPALKSRIQIISKCDIMLLSEKHPDRRVKYYDTTAAHITASVEVSLRLMGIEALDLLLLHRPDPLMNPDETGPALDGLIRSGKVRAVGVSNFRPWDWDLLQSRMSTPLATNQIEMSLMAREAFTNGDLAMLQQRRLRPMAWSPLGGGGLFDSSMHAYERLTPRLREMAAETGTDIAAVATAWLLAHPAGILPILGTSNPKRIARIADCLKVGIDRQTWFELWTLAEGREVP